MINEQTIATATTDEVGKSPIRGCRELVEEAIRNIKECN